jgi:RNA polymerase sigma-70 factor (ECF subfamily)
MVEDELLKLGFKRGSRDALQRIYEKYLDYLVTLAMGLLNDTSAAEDVVHDVFVAFARSSKDFRLSGSLKGYLTTCVANRVRDRIRRQPRAHATAHEQSGAKPQPTEPEQSVICSEQAHRISEAMSWLPYEQREVVVLHLKNDMRFREIAKLQNVSVNTIQGRYRYGLAKLRSILDGEAEYET